MILNTKVDSSGKKKYVLKERDQASIQKPFGFFFVFHDAFEYKSISTGNSKVARKINS